MYLFLFFAHEITSLDYNISADNYLLSVMVEGTNLKNIYVPKNEIIQGSIAGKQRDMLIFEIKNGEGGTTNPIGIGGTITLDEHIFSIDHREHPFLLCNYTLGNSLYHNISTRTYKGKINEINFFNFTIPKIIFIEYSPDVIAYGINLDLSELNNFYTKMKFNELPTKGQLTIDTVVPTINSPYSTSSKFHYKPEKEMTVDRITYEFFFN